MLRVSHRIVLIHSFRCTPFDGKLFQYSASNRTDFVTDKKERRYFFGQSVVKMKIAIPHNWIGFYRRWKVKSDADRNGRIFSNGDNGLLIKGQDLQAWMLSL